MMLVGKHAQQIVWYLWSISTKRVSASCTGTLSVGAEFPVMSAGRITFTQTAGVEALAKVQDVEAGGFVCFRKLHRTLLLP